MWIVAKVRSKELNTFKKNLTDKLDKDVKFYYPKIEYKKIIKSRVKKFEKILLENYIFCYHAKFSKYELINNIRFIKGLEYFLEGHVQNQKEIIKFINYCKLFENEKGYLVASFFKNII